MAIQVGFGVRHGSGRAKFFEALLMLPAVRLHLKLEIGLHLVIAYGWSYYILEGLRPTHSGSRGINPDSFRGEQY